MYALTPKEYKDLSCEFCGKLFNTNTFCEDAHYICENCHQSDAIKIIEDLAEKTDIKDHSLKERIVLSIKISIQFS